VTIGMGDVVGRGRSGMAGMPTWSALAINDDVTTTIE